MNVEIYDTCEDKRNLYTDFEPENIVITSVTNSSLGCDCLHRARFRLSIGWGWSQLSSQAVTCGSHLRELGMRRETLPKHSRILKSMESEIGRHKLLHNTEIFEQSRSARTMGIHN